jgi:hypothetical protein
MEDNEPVESDDSPASEADGSEGDTSPVRNLPAS